MRIRNLAAFLSLALLVVLTGCSGSNRISHTSAEQAFQRGKAQYDDGDYDRAIRYFRGVFQYGRGSQWADDAQFYLANSYREQGKYLIAANEYERFSQLYRNNQRRPEAEYQRAMMYYKLSPRYQLDQSNSRRAISYFQLFIERNPRHELVADAQTKIDELRNKMARKQFEAGELYERRDMWEASALTFAGVFDSYPDTEWADDALLGAVRAYIEYADRSVRNKVDDRLEKAISNYERLTQVFPDSPLLGRAETLYQEAQSKLDAYEQEEAASNADSESIASEGS